ncbi:rhamnulokinase family protein [soil metagenome]
MTATHYLAVDLGGESGRVVLGTLADGKLSLEEIHRFPNGPVKKGSNLLWDLHSLEREINQGIAKAAAGSKNIAGISTDSWGVDYVLLDADGNALSDPYCYRDPRTDSSPKRLFGKIAFVEIYARTGIQFMAINTLYQLEAHQHDDPASLKKAHHLLTIADYFNARFSGVAAIEQSMASTTQIYDPQNRDWSDTLIESLGVSKSLFPRIVPSGTLLGPMMAPASEAAKMPLVDTKVIATCSHDTGSAIAAVPVKSATPWAYLSSGTWSLLGAELTTPVLTAAAREAGFTNEVGLGGTIRFLKNIAGLWVLQECRRAWEAAGQSYNYTELTRMAVENGPAVSHLRLDDHRFVSAGDMPAKIAAYCRETNQPIPQSPGQVVRTILESLALTYAHTLDTLSRVTGQKYQTLHIVGGGSRNDLLNELTASATGISVVAGPVEATAVGNLLIQALALGHLASAAELRQVVARSFPTKLVPPGTAFAPAVIERFNALR